MAFTKSTLTLDVRVKIDLKQLKKFKPPKLTDKQIKQFKRRLIVRLWKRLNESGTAFEGTT